MKQVTMYKKNASDLREGDYILTPRLTVVQVTQVSSKVTSGLGGRIVMHVETKSPVATDSICYCFQNDEMVLVVE